MDLTYRVFHPATAQYTFFSAVHRTFSKIIHILGHKASLNKYKKNEITPSIMCDYNTMKLKLNNKRSSKTYMNTCRLSYTFLNDEWVIEEIQHKIKKFLDLMKIKFNISEPMGLSKVSTKGESLQP
jgi:hypothetical protein